MKEREVAKRNLLILQQMEFEAETIQYKNEKSNLEERFKKFSESLVKQIHSPKKDEKENLNIQYKNENYNKLNILERNLAHEKTDTSLNIKEVVHKKTSSNKVIRSRVREKITSQSNYSDLKASEKIAPEPKKKEQPQYRLRYRIRLGPSNRLIIDKYIQSEYSFSAFDDDFNLSIDNFKNYNSEWELKSQKQKDFNSFYHQYLLIHSKKIASSESDDDVNFNTQQFAKSYTQFLKHKRSNPELSI